MFDSFRKYNKIIMVFLFLLIIPSFVLFGVDRYQGGGQGEKVARVDGVDITRPDWDAQHRNEVDRIRQQAPNIDASLLDSDAARYATLDPSRLLERQVPGVGAVIAAAVEAFAGDVSRFSSVKRYAAFYGLVPRTKQTGGADGKPVTRRSW